MGPAAQYAHSARRNGKCGRLYITQFGGPKSISQNPLRGGGGGLQFVLTLVVEFISDQYPGGWRWSQPQLRLDRTK